MKPEGGDHGKPEHEGDKKHKKITEIPKPSPEQWQERSRLLAQRQIFEQSLQRIEVSIRNVLSVIDEASALLADFNAQNPNFNLRRYQLFSSPTKISQGGLKLERSFSAEEVQSFDEWDNFCRKWRQLTFEIFDFRSPKIHNLEAIIGRERKLPLILKPTINRAKRYLDLVFILLKVEDVPPEQALEKMLDFKKSAESLLFDKQ